MRARVLGVGLLIGLALASCGKADDIQSTIAPQCRESLFGTQWQTGYQWTKAREPYAKVMLSHDTSLCQGYTACVLPMRGGESAALVMPFDGDLCLFEHERLHLMGWIHPLTTKE